MTKDKYKKSYENVIKLVKEAEYEIIKNEYDYIIDDEEIDKDWNDLSLYMLINFSIGE